MKIKEIRAFEIDLGPFPKTTPHTPSRAKSIHMRRPTFRYPQFRDNPTDNPTKSWKHTACVVTGEDGTWGFGISVHAGAAVKVIINDIFAPLVVGENCMATEKLWDVMVRASTAYGAMGLASYALSAVDCALWDLKGKLLGRPVYELLGGPQKDKIFCYATGFDQAWYMELGFKATKIFTPYGPEDGLEGLKKNEELVAETREMVGDEVELMLDAWSNPDIEYAVRLAETMRPYNLKWIEEYLPADDLAGYETVRQRVPWQTLATGEHWYLTKTFAAAAHRHWVDILQPDALWAGGITALVKICHIAEAANVSVIAHAGMNYPYGQHVSYAMPAILWGERSEGVSSPGVPLEEMVKLPGTPIIKDGYLTPSDAPGFGLEIDEAWLEKVMV